MTGADLQAGSAGAFQRAAAEAFIDVLPVPIREILDPAQTPLTFLPHLAVHEGVRLWYSDWSRERKRQIIADWPRLAALIGTRAAAQRFLDYVDAEIIHKVSYPAVRPVGRLAVGVHPISHKHHRARFLVKTKLTAPRRAIVVGRTAVGRACIRPASVEPLERAKHALVTAKAPATEYGVTFAHRLPITLDDEISLDGPGFAFGSFKDRTRL